MAAGGRAPKTAAALLVCAGLLSACSGGGGDDGPAAPSTSEATGEVVDGGTIRLGMAGPVVADPAAASLGSPTDLLVLDLLHDGLTRLDDEGQPQPALAASWRSNDTLTAWRFTLDPDAAFADGTAITAADVIASLEHVAKGGDASLAALSPGADQRLPRLRGGHHAAPAPASRRRTPRRCGSPSTPRCPSCRRSWPAPCSASSTWPRWPTTTATWTR